MFDGRDKLLDRNVMVFKPLQPLNTLPPMQVTDFGISMFVKLVQPRNALSPRVVTELGRVTKRVFVNCFISTACVLNGRKVMMWILYRLEKMKF